MALSHLSLLAPRGLQLTDRDLTVLRYVQRYRLLTVEQLLTVTDGSVQTRTKRLTHLERSGYLTRVRHPQARYYSPGRRPRVYGLGRGAPQVLEDHFGIPRGKTDWQRRNREAGSQLVGHTLFTAAIMLPIELYCRDHGVVQFVDQEEILATAPAPTRCQKKPLRWQTRIPHQQDSLTLGVEPDRLFGLRLPWLPELRQTMYFCLEADTGSEPIERTTLKGTSLARKFLAYIASYHARLPQAHFGIRRFPRILVVTSSRLRVHHMIEAFQRVSREYQAHTGKRTPANLFLCTDQAALDPRNILASPWRNGHGEEVRLLTSFDSQGDFVAALRHEVSLNGSRQQPLPETDRVVHLTERPHAADVNGPSCPTRLAVAVLRGQVLGLRLDGDEVAAFGQQVERLGFRLAPDGTEEA